MDFNSLKTFDESVLEPLHELQAEGEPSFVGGLITDYLQQVEELNSNIQTAQRTADIKTLERAAHKLKSSSAVLGLTKLAAICLAIEGGARANQPTDAQVKALNVGVNEATTALKSYLATLK